MHELSPPRVTELLHAYLDADYRWELDGQWRHISIGAPAPEIDSAFPAAHRYALLSAWDPHSVVRQESINRQQDELLRLSILEQHYAGRAAFSSAPDRSWREPSWLVIDMPTTTLDALARRFGQLGTLSWERGQPVRLRMDAVRPEGFKPNGPIDWLR